MLKELFDDLTDEELEALERAWLLGITFPELLIDDIDNGTPVEQYLRSKSYE